MLDSILVISYDSHMATKNETICCDGTGWTGEEGVICAEHYNSNAELYAIVQEMNSYAEARGYFD